MIYKSLIHLALIAVAFTSALASAGQVTTITCGPLSGIKVELVDGRANTVPETQVGPIFFIDSENPQQLISLWKTKLFDKETTEKYEAVIVESNNVKVHAIECDDSGLHSYTIFLKDGTLFYSFHRLRSPFDKGSTLLSYVGKCEVKAN